MNKGGFFTIIRMLFWFSLALVFGAMILRQAERLDEYFGNSCCCKGLE